MKNSILKIATVILVLFIFAGIGSASMFGNYGKIVPNATAEKNFEAAKMDPNMTYYFSGPETTPTAIIGVNNNYVLDSDMWKPIPYDSKMLEDLIQNVKSEELEYGRQYHGFDIISPDGQIIGECYSQVFEEYVKMEPNNKVIFAPPDPSTVADES